MKIKALYSCYTSTKCRNESQVVKPLFIIYFLYMYYTIFLILHMYIRLVAIPILID